jgi:predicted MFS family arabinose efflux permease
MALYTLAYAVSHIIGPFLGTQIIHRFGFNTLWVTLAVLAAFAFIGTRALERQDDARNVAVEA